MLPRLPEKNPPKSEAFIFMIRYLMLINIPFKAEYDETDNELKYIRIRNYKIYDEKIIKDIKRLCCQLHGYFTEGGVDDLYPYLDIEWT